MTVERFFLNGSDAGISVGEGNRVVGYAAKFGTLSHPQQSGARYRIRPEAFSTALQNTEWDTTLNLDHDDSRLLARTKSGTLQLAQDEIGLRFTAVLPDTTAGRDAKELLARGDLYECSFAYEVHPDTWQQVKDNGETIREIVNVAVLLDVSLVVRAAFPNTEVDLRSRETPKDFPLIREATYRQMEAELHI